LLYDRFSGNLYDMTNIIEIKHLHFSYSEKSVFTRANLEITDNGFYCIVGGNGSGKTTLLKLLLGFLKPHDGVINIWGKSPEKARQFIGYMPQEMQFDPLFPITTREVLEMGYLPHKAPVHLPQELIESLDLENLLESQFSALSGGQRQRVLLGRALINSPKLLLFDEPTANVDKQNQERIMRYLAARKSDVCIVMVSHDVHFVSPLIDRVICVEEGDIHVHPTEFLAGIERSLSQKLGNIVQHDRCVDCKHEDDENES